MIKNLINLGRLPIGTRVAFMWRGVEVEGTVKMSHQYWNGSLLVIVPEYVDTTGYPRFVGNKAVDIPRHSVRVLARNS